MNDYGYNIIVENDNACLWYNNFDCELWKTSKKGVQKLTFEDFIREVDTIPELSAECKAEIINVWSKHYGLIKRGA